MRRRETLPLHTHFLAQRVAELQMKQWALARLVGVSRKTVSRWLTGRVTRIARHNAERLCEILGCRIEELTVSDALPLHATIIEQRAAADLLEEHDLVALLSPSGNWELAEGLIRATLHPDLPPAHQGRLLNLLSITAWRRGRFVEGRERAVQARRAGEEARDGGVQVKAAANLATIDSLTGRHAEALAGYQFCLEHADQFALPRDHAGVLTNISMVYRDFARFEESLHYQEEAIRVFTALDLPFNLAIAYLCLGVIATECGQWDRAAQALRSSRTHAEDARYALHLTVLPFYEADVAALQGDLETAAGHLATGLMGIADEVHYDPACHEIAARIARLRRDLEEAEAQLEAGMARARDLLPARALLLQERARLADAREDRAGARRACEEANRIFRETGLEARIMPAPLAEYGHLFG